jgi:hypothetical protein
LFEYLCSSLIIGWQPEINMLWVFALSEFHGGD